jgi:hypothetical protein
MLIKGWRLKKLKEMPSTTGLKGDLSTDTILDPS